MSDDKGVSNSGDVSQPTPTSVETKELDNNPIDLPTPKPASSDDSEYETMESNENSASSRASERTSVSDSAEQVNDELINDGREEADGEELDAGEDSVKDKKLDDDEDKRNPQYIPKRGTFYEHDDRTMSNNNTNTKEAEPKREEIIVQVETNPKAVKKGKVWTEKSDRWTHDLYDEVQQTPKSAEELIQTYGYNIRSEEAPPKAPRRRKYGRGPNKYTRNWEDGDAYNRSAGSVQGRVLTDNSEEFPALKDTSKSKRAPKRGDKSSQNKPFRPKQVPPKQSQPPSVVKGAKRDQEKIIAEKPAEQVKVSPPPKPLPEKPVTEVPKPSVVNQEPPKEMVPNVRVDKKQVDQRVGRGRGFIGTGKARQPMEIVPSRGPPPTYNNTSGMPGNDTLKHASDKLMQDFNHLYLSGNNNNTNNMKSHTNIVEETIVPRSQRPNQQAGSKRYSAQRQRTLPETTPPPTYSPPHNLPYYTQPPPTSFVPAQVYNEVAPPSVSSPPMQMVAFLPPGPPPTAASAPPYPPPSLLNYMPQPPFTTMALPPPTISGQFEDLSQATEVYQRQNGITYYSTQTQNVVPRQNPPRRVKLAIPIVPPPDIGDDKPRASEVQPAAS